MGGVPALRRLGLPARQEAFPGVLAQRLQQPVARGPVRLLLRLRQRLVHQPRQEVLDLLARDPPPRADRLGRLQGPVPGEDRQPLQEPALRLVQEVVAPAWIIHGVGRSLWS
ncbi:MAG: hypothetical protein ACR2JY_14540 [Chloroflexota bacterium]